MSVWDDMESLKNFVYKTIHVELIQNRDAWFDKIINVHQAMWWTPEGTLPKSKKPKKLEYLQKHGPSQEAFTLAKSFSQYKPSIS